MSCNYNGINTGFRNLYPKGFEKSGEIFDLGFIFVNSIYAKKIKNENLLSDEEIDEFLTYGPGLQKSNLYPTNIFTPPRKRRVRSNYQIRRMIFDEIYYYLAPPSVIIPPKEPEPPSRSEIIQAVQEAGQRYRHDLDIYQYNTLIQIAWGKAYKKYKADKEEYDRLSEAAGHREPLYEYGSGSYVPVSDDDKTKLFDVICRMRNVSTKDDLDAPYLSNDRAVFIPYRRIDDMIYYNIFLELYDHYSTDALKFPRGSGFSMIISATGFHTREDDKLDDYKIVKGSLSFFRPDKNFKNYNEDFRDYMFGFNWDSRVPWFKDGEMIPESQRRDRFDPLPLQPDYGNVNCGQHEIDDTGKTIAFGEMYQFTYIPSNFRENWKRTEFFSTENQAQRLYVNMIIRDEEKFLTLAQSQEDNNRSKQLVVRSAPHINHPSHPDHPQKQHTHEEHMKEREKNNTALFLGLTLGLALPLILLITYLAYRMRSR